MALQKFISLGELKQSLTRDYNKINSKIFSSGVVSLKIEIIEEKYSCWPYINVLCHSII